MDRLAEDKRRVRESARATRRSITAERREHASMQVAERIAALAEEWETGATVLAYAALSEEIDPAPATARLKARGLSVALPRVALDGRLDICRVEDDTELEEGPFGILEPVEGSRSLDPSSIDVVLVPGVAFDTDGHRLGFGGGYYDRLVPELSERCLTIGLAFDEQVFEQIPHDEHDVRIKVLLTPTRVLFVGGQRPAR